MERSKLILLLIAGSLTWIATMFKSGIVYDYGMGFWGPNGHDGIWHVALAESLKRGSFDMPIFSGEQLKNYHLGFDLMIALTSKLTGISVIHLYFQILPILIAFLIGFLTYKFTFLWTRSEKASLLSTFFVYFGGDLAWILGKGESTFWSQQGVSTLINPPFALSLVVLLLGLISLQKGKRFLSIIFFGVLIAIKSYAGALILGALLVTGIYEYIKEKNTKILFIFLGALVLSLLLYLPVNKNSVSLLTLQPFWFLETLMGPDRLNWPRLYSAMNTYKVSNNLLKGIPAYILAFIIFWLGNMGFRVFKELLLVKWFKNIKRVGYLEVFMSSIILAGGIIPMLFLQKGTSWNTIQFFYYSLFFSAILAGIAIEKFNKLIILAIVILTLPTTFTTLKNVYLPSRPPAKVSQEELSALKFLSNQPQGIVLTYPFDKAKADEAIKSPPRPLYLYESTAYVSALSKQKVFLEDEVNLDIMGYNWKERRASIKKWCEETDSEKAKDFLTINRIKYIYWIKSQRTFLDHNQLRLEKIFDNNLVEIYEVDF